MARSTNEIFQKFYQNLITNIKKRMKVIVNLEIKYRYFLFDIVACSFHVIRICDKF